VETPKDLFNIINYSVLEEPQVPEIFQNDEISINCHEQDNMESK